MHAVPTAAATWRRRLDDRRAAALQARLPLLDPHEREVLQRIAAGQRTDQIALTLQVSVRTVEQHRAALLRKMRAATMLELVSLAAGAAA